jgi:hypothetical protein
VKSRKAMLPLLAPTTEKEKLRRAIAAALRCPLDEIQILFQMLPLKNSNATYPHHRPRCARHLVDEAAKAQETAAVCAL